MLAEQLAGVAIDEVKPGAGLANHGFVSACGVAWLRLFQPMLHVHPGPRTFEDQITHTSLSVCQERNWLLDLDQGRLLKWQAFATTCAAFGC
ncbi:hypothetical protein [Bradyrhizobium aeschynomenes]|uniref:hypothetical protein n=1 Tax=Bradyrhizobium aeschynomenes TaxID=2734909 RepID=UPI0015527C85|nr:hypothetical protein [Bradyrhizobium aeschynomenes]NPV25503.1 hypothetical protein [Bradyrhizobium aeschynomenes]